jgi:hypothetical protein
MFKPIPSNVFAMKASTGKHLIESSQDGVTTKPMLLVVTAVVYQQRPIPFELTVKIGATALELFARLSLVLKAKN